jgi:hypothetical protein
VATKVPFSGSQPQILNNGILPGGSEADTRHSTQHTAQKDEHRSIGEQTYTATGFAPTQHDSVEYSFKGEEKKRKGRRRERIEVGGISNWSVVAIQVGIRVTSINDLVSGGLKHNGGNIPLQSIHISGRILFTASSKGEVRLAAKVATGVETRLAARAVTTLGVMVRVCSILLF